LVLPFSTLGPYTHPTHQKVKKIIRRRNNYNIPNKQKTLNGKRPALYLNKPRK
jgi:hypothetical protein